MLLWDIVAEEPLQSRLQKTQQPQAAQAAAATAHQHTIVRQDDSQLAWLKQMIW